MQENCIAILGDVEEWKSRRREGDSRGREKLSFEEATRFGFESGFSDRREDSRECL